jgi:predicted ATPase/signal transduction histidine kinase
MLTLDEVRKEGTRVSSIALGPIPREHLAAFVSEALHCTVEDAAPLSDLVYEKTAGNPFFAIQFLLSLHEERLIDLDASAGAFRWDMARIRAKDFTANVVDLMIGKLRRLPPSTQEALKQLACLGNSAEVALLAMVHGRSEQDTHADLWDAVHAGLVLRVNGTYKFLHDRVQQAAYALIEDDEKKEVHVKIGRLLLASVDARSLEERIFDVVTQLNHGVDLITDRAERDELARLNIIAGRKAKAAIAYVSARSFLTVAMAVLPEDAWDSRYDVLFPLFMERAECEYLCGAFEQAEALFDVLFARTRTDFDKATVYELRLKLCHVAGKYDEAVTMARKALHLFGVDIPENDDALREAIRAETDAVKVNLGDRRIADLADAPEATDPRVRAVIGLLSNVTGAAYIGSRPQVFPLVILKLVNHSLRFGNTHESCMGYSAYGIMLVSLFDDPRSAYEFSEMSIKLNQKLGDISRRGTVLHLHGDHINFWIHPIATDFPILEKGFHACLDAGDLVFASYIAFEIIWQAVERGDPIDDVLELSRKYAAFARDSRNDPVYQTIRIEQQFLACLKGRTRGSATFDDESFQETPCLAKIADAAFQCGIVFYHVMKLITAYLSGDAPGACYHANEAKKTLSAAMAMPMEATFYYFHALVLADSYPQAASEEARREILRTLEHHSRKLGLWAESCPENFLAKHALVCAEIARITGDELGAERRYEEAIRSARESGFVHWEGIAGELAARFYRERGFETPANAYLREALRCYVRWGAEVKVRQLEQRYPCLREVPPAGAAATFLAAPEQLEMRSVVKALQSISSEILVPKLSETLLKIMLQQAGGQRGALILVRDHQLAVEAEATTDGQEIRVESLQGAHASSEAFPTSILHYVSRTREPVILNEAAASARFASDEYLVRRRPRSLLCFPIVRQARVSGVVYLENNLVTGAFTADTIHVLELLGAQAAISLDNATLYADLERSRRELAAVLDNMVDSVFVADLTGHVTLVNQAAARLTGLASPQEALGPLMDLARRIRFDRPNGVPFEAEQTPLLRALRGETVALDEGTISLPGAERIRFLHTSASPMRDERGEVVGAVAVSRDVTELVELDRLKDQFLRVAAHELKTPVAVIMGYAETLSRMASELAPNQRRMLDGLLRGAGRIDRIVSDLLFLSQVKLDRLNLVMERVDLGDLVARAAARAMQTAPARRVRITRTEPVVLQGDRELLGRVVAHLIDNAVRYSPEGGDVEVNVRIAEARDAIVSVRDHGVGIPAGKCSRIFECFYRAHTDTAHDYGGMGTGLYLSRVVVARHGGEMWFETEEGHGSAFHVRLPLRNEGVPAPR